MKPTLLRSLARVLTPIGLFLSISSLLALSGPGRIDIVDGQTRYEVARSLVDHGDLAIRDPDAYFAVFLGRGGQLHTTYRLPHSLVAVPTLWAADLVGDPSEPRRHFFFSLVGSVAAGVLALSYLAWFRSTGLAPREAAAWAAAGILCTPSWYYGTSTFDDLQGSAVVVAALVVARVVGARRAVVAGAVAGVLLGIAFNYKQPLGIFVLPVLGLLTTTRARVAACAAVLPGLLGGVAFEAGLRRWCFPPGTLTPEQLAAYGPVFARSPLPGLIALAISPGAGALWYSPPVLLCLSGAAVEARRAPGFLVGLAAAVAVFYGFISSLSFFKGDPAWGPRYLTPLFATLWLLAPSSLETEKRGRVRAVLGLGFVVQLLALSVDVQRMHLALQIPNNLHVQFPWLYFQPQFSSLLARPAEIVHTLLHAAPEAYSPMSCVTKATGPVSLTEAPDVARRFQVYAGLRPWWASFTFLPAALRPVEVGSTLCALAALGSIGLGSLSVGLFVETGESR